MSGSNVTPELLEPGRLWTRAEVLASPSPVPKAAGVYAWYLTALPAEIDVSSCHSFGGGIMLYTGIAPRKPYADGRRSKATLHQRVRYHYRGNAEGSTLRLTLGVLLADSLGLELRRTGSGRRRTFGTGEATLSEWMAAYARVAWVTTGEPWLVEEELIATFDLPLNLDQNSRNAFHGHLSSARKAAKKRAAALPVIAQ